MGLLNEPPASRKTARRVGVIVVVVGLTLTVFATAKHFAMGGLADAEIAAGEAAIAEAVAGDLDGYDRAQESFRDAASVSILDYYPAFGLTVIERLRELEAGAEATEAGDDVLVALSRQDWQAARAAVDAMRDSEPKRADYYDRMVESVRQSSMKLE